MRKENLMLSDLAHELDNGISHIAVKLGTLGDARTVLGQLRMDLDNIDEKDARLYFHKFHLQIRLIDDLIHYTMNSLDDQFEEVRDIKKYYIYKSDERTTNRKKLLTR